jgi:integrase/recombinase XerC
MKNEPLSISDAIELYLQSVELSRSENTARTYRNAMISLKAAIASHGFPTTATPVQEIKEDAVAWLAADLKVYSPATERLYLTATAGFFDYLSAERLASLNLPRVRLLIRQRARRPGQRLPQFPKDFIEVVLDYAKNIANRPDQEQNEMLRSLRDRAFLLTLADTGLRVHEACSLRRGDLDWNESKAIIIGKGNRQAVVRFSQRSTEALKEYLAARGFIDGATGRPLSSLPLFARHDKGAGQKIKPITTRTGQNIVSLRVKEAVGSGAEGTITPHSFRHYFVTTVLRGSGNLKLAQELARHQNIAVTQRYAHLSDDELDRGYADIFES